MPKNAERRIIDIIAANSSQQGFISFPPFSYSVMLCFSRQLLGEPEIVAGRAPQGNYIAPHIAVHNLQLGHTRRRHAGKRSAVRADEQTIALLDEWSMNMPEDQNLHIHLPGHHLRVQQI